MEVPCTTKPAPGRVVYPIGRAALSPLSMRDEFILKRARALWSRSFKFTAGYKPIWSWRRRFEGNELRNPQPSCDRENDFLDGNSVEHRHASRGQLATGQIGRQKARRWTEVLRGGSRLDPAY